MGAGVSVPVPQESATVTRAGAVVVFPAWLPGVPDFRFEMAATAVSERE